MEWVVLIAAALNAVGIVGAWVAKILWAREYRTAVEATIRAKDAQIDVLRSQLEHWRSWTPVKLEEYWQSAMRQYEDVLERVQAPLAAAKQLEASLQTRNEELKGKVAGESARAIQLERQRDRARDERDVLNARVTALDAAARRVRYQLVSYGPGTIPRPWHDEWRQIYEASASLHEVIKNSPDGQPQWITTSQQAVTATGEALQTSQDRPAFIRRLDDPQEPGQGVS